MTLGFVAAHYQELFPRVQKEKKPPQSNLQGLFLKNSGDKEIRTLDPLLAKQVLYQLSYTPISYCATARL